MPTKQFLWNETQNLCGNDAKKLFDRYDSLQSSIDKILDVSDRAKRQLTDRELADIEAYQSEVRRIEPLLPASRPRIVAPSQPGGGDYRGHGGSVPVSEWLDASGNRVYSLSPNERFTDLPGSNDGGGELSIGRLIVALSTGRWQNARREQLAFQSEGGNSQGGYLVSPGFSRRLIDLARAKSVCIQAGAQTVPWTDSDTLSLAAVKTDPTFELKSENAIFAGSTVAFEQVTLTAKLIGTVVKMSRELAEDASNAAQIVEDVLSRSFACELDRQVLNGSGSQELLGLLNKPSIPVSNASVGAATWQALHSAATVVRLANYTPGAYVCNPQVSADLDEIQASTAGTWLGPPPSLATVRRFDTTACPLASAVVGDFTNLAIGLRQEPRLEISTEAGDAFAAHQLWIKLTWRGDAVALRPSAFATMGGITT